MNEIVEVRNLIYTIRGQKVMIDSDLASLYGVETRVLNQAVKRNIDRFPSDFMFQLNENEFKELITICDNLNLKYSPRTPYVFTEQGVAMLSGILKSKRAVEVNIQIMSAFVKMRQWAIENKEMAQRIAELEHYFIEHCKDNKQDKEETKQNLAKIYEAINLLMDRTKPSKIGFNLNNDETRF